MRELRRLTAAAGAILVAASLAACGAASVAPAAAPRPSRTAPASAAQATGLQDPVSDVTATSRALPVRIVIPAIGVDASLLHLVRGADGVLQAPPSNELDKAGWYAKGTVPGQIGPAVIAGHVDWVHRVAVFHRLGELKAGDAITVVMSDRTRVRFLVDRTRTVSKFHFPTASVYGPTPDPQLRVITCGGPWDDARNIYSENVVVEATEAA